MLLTSTAVFLALGTYNVGILPTPISPVEKSALPEIIKYEPNLKEGAYAKKWCTSDVGALEYVLADKTRVDCLTHEYAIEFDFGKKWAESVGQSLYYAKMTGKKPAVVMILRAPTDVKYMERIKTIDKDIKIFQIQAY